MNVESMQSKVFPIVTNEWPPKTISEVKLLHQLSALLPRRSEQ